MRETVGIIGVGIVGSACKFGFEKLGHKVLVHDTKLNTLISDVLPASVIFLCVPSPSSESGECNTKILENVVKNLAELSYTGVVAIKTTVPPGTTKMLQKRHPNLTLAFVPEFLRERCAISDFVENHILLAVGTTGRTNDKEVCELLFRIHGSYPKKKTHLESGEAEMLKYYSNIFNALRVTFANEVYELCENLDINYTNVKNAYIETGMVPDQYLDVNENFRAFAGGCLVKDTKALAYLIRKRNLPCRLIETIDIENQRYKPTVFPGMREK